MNYFGFGANFISCWIRIRIRNADPDPGDKFNADPCGSGSETLLKKMRKRCVKPLILNSSSNFSRDTI
jgi:hypothetical protein